MEEEYINAVSEEIVEEDVLRHQFFNELYYLSPSALNKYLYHPRAWYNWYVLKNKEDRKETKALIEGSLIHLLILEPEKFSERYIISKEDIVKDTPKDVLNTAFSLADGKPIEESSEAILQAMTQHNYFQSLKEDNKRLEKMMTPSSTEYWNFLKEKSDKTLISQAQFEFCNKGASVINSTYRDLLGLDGGAGIETFNELKLEMKTSYVFGFKGIIDNLVIDHLRKKVVLNDIKTTSKTLREFATGSIEFFGYDLQLSMYALMVGKRHQDLFEKGYTLSVNIVAVTPFGDSYAFPVSDNTLERWVTKLLVALNEFKWSFENEDFSNHRVFLEKDYIL